MIRSNNPPPPQKKREKAKARLSFSSYNWNDISFLKPENRKSIG